MQLRQSQQTYRMKKATTCKNYEERIAHLEAAVGRARQMIANLGQYTLQSSLNVESPEIYAQLYVIDNFLSIEMAAAPASIVPQTDVKDAPYGIINQAAEELVTNAFNGLDTMCNGTRFSALPSIGGVYGCFDISSESWQCGK